jgi:hypothetical protein
VPDPTITISSPAPGATVPRTFPVSGAYTPTTASPAIGLLLKDSTGAVVATSGTTGNNGTFSGSLTAPGPLAGASVEATLGTASDTVSNITVQ